LSTTELTENAMNPRELFCPQDDCPSRGVIGAGNITIHSQKPPRCKCSACGRTFTLSRGSAFYRLHKKALFVIVSTLLAFGCPPQAIVAAFGLDERTVYAWMQRAGQQAERVQEHLLCEHPMALSHVQADEIRVKCQKRKVVWMAMAICVPTRLWLGGLVSESRDNVLIEALCAKIKACAVFGRLLVCVDGLAAYVHALQKAFRTPIWTGRAGRPRLLAWPLRIGQVIKRKEPGRVARVEQRMVQGTLEQARALLGTEKLNTAYIERLNATFRARVSSLVRRGRGLARQVSTLHAGMYLLGTVYNLCTYHKSLRQEQPQGRRKWNKRTPAMAAGLTDHRWTLEELMAYRVPPAPYVPQRRRGRPPGSANSPALAGAQT
jgi:transposase-like protein